MIHLSNPPTSKRDGTEYSVVLKILCELEKV